jgi:uncharacterized membrane protein
MSKKMKSVVLSICLLTLFMAYTHPINAYYNPALEVEVFGYNLTAGDENQMRISIDNVGRSYAYDVKASLMVPSTVLGISIVNGSYAVFERIRGSAGYYHEMEWMHPVLYVSRECQMGAYSLTLTLEYTDSEDRVYVDDVQVGVVVDVLKPVEVELSVDVEDYNLKAGAENEIDITILNVGEKAVYDVEAVLSSTSSGIVVLR